MSDLSKLYQSLQKEMDREFIFSSIASSFSSYTQVDLDFLEEKIKSYTDNKPEKKAELFKEYIKKVLNTIDPETTVENSYNISASWNNFLLSEKELPYLKNTETQKDIIKIFKDAKTFSELSFHEEFLFDLFKKDILTDKAYRSIIVNCIENIYQTQEDEIIQKFLKWIVDTKKVELTPEENKKISLNLLLNEDRTFLQFFKYIKEKESLPKEINEYEKIIEIFNPNYKNEFDSYLQEKWLLEYFQSSLTMGVKNMLILDSTEYKELAFYKVAKEQNITEKELNVLFFNEKVFKLIDSIDANENKQLGKFKDSAPLNTLKHYLNIYNSIASSFDFSSIKVNEEDSFEKIKSIFHKLYLENTMTVEANSNFKKLKL